MKLSKLFKESRIVKATKKNLKIGDYVYYFSTIINTRKYCKVTKIEGNSPLEIWGKWSTDKTLKTGCNTEKYTTEQVYIIR